MTGQPLLERFRAAVAGRYQVEREVGEGGMAKVFLARDLKYDRKVAVKVLRPDLAAEVGATRFLREIQFAARLHHPHILPLYDSDQVDDLVYYVMPYIEGETLQQRLAREGQLPIGDAVQIAREVADAMSYAHSSNVIHRDIKPANILLESRHALVADFGIARALGGGEATTQQIIGTPTYMSPEQIDASPDLDSRSDIYSLGCVLFETLVGAPPFRGTTVTAVIANRLSAPMPSPRAFREQVPEAVDAAVRKAMATQPADRFATAAEFAEALAAPMAVAVSGGTAQGLRTPSSTTNSVAVLPFENMSNEPENEYFSDGITDDIIAQLTKISALKVISRTSSMRYRKTTRTMSAVAQELGVGAILEGSVRRAGPRVRIVAHLINPETEQLLWGDTFDRQLTDVFAVQSEVAQRIAGALSVALSTEEKQRVERKPAGGTDMSEAYTLYLRGRYFAQQRDPESLRTALVYFDKAIALDPGYALAHAGAGETWAIRGFEEFGDLPPLEAMPRALSAVNRALELDPELGEAHLYRGVIALMFEYDPAEAADRLTRAMKLVPSNPFGHAWYGLLLACLGRSEESVAKMLQAERLDPVGVATQWVLGRALLLAGRYEESLQRFKVVVEMNPHTMAAAWVARAHLGAGRPDLGLAAVETAIGQLGRQPLLLEVLGHCMAELGRGDEARLLIGELEELGRVRHVSGVHGASIHGRLGEDDAALRDLEEAARQRSGYLAFAATYDGLDRVRETPQFRDLMRRVGLGAFVPTR